MHWAAHKHTAVEVIYQRADADKDNMGLTTWSGNYIMRSDVEVEKIILMKKSWMRSIKLLQRIWILQRYML